MNAVHAKLALANNSFTPEQYSVLDHNWPYCWCEQPLDDPSQAAAGAVGQLHHDFKLYLGNVTRLYDPSTAGTAALYEGELFLQQYFSSLYWSLTMLMKTAYVGPDTVFEKGLSCLLVLLGAIVFAVIMGAVVAIIKTIEAKNAQLRNVIQQHEVFSASRELPRQMTRSLLRFVETQWIKTAGLEANDVLGKRMRLPTRFHDEILLAVYGHTPTDEEGVIERCPLLAAARDSPGAGALPPLLRLLTPQVVLQKQLVMSDTWMLTDLFVLVKGTLQAELSLQMRVNLEHAAGAQHNRRGGGDLLGAAAGVLGGGCSAAELAEAVSASAAQPSYRGGAAGSGGAPSRGGKAAAEGAEGGPSPDGAPPMARSQTGKRGSCMGGARDATRSRTNTRKRDWKKNLQARHMMEKSGQMIGVPDPMSKSVFPSPFIVTALKQSDVLVIQKAPLRATLNLLPVEDAHRLCLSVQKEYNQVCNNLKAKELVCDSVDKRKEEHEKALEEQRVHSAGLAHASALEALGERIGELETNVDRAATTANNLRVQCSALHKARELLEPWAKKRGVDPALGPGTRRAALGGDPGAVLRNDAVPGTPEGSSRLGWAPKVMGTGDDDSSRNPTSGKGAFMAVFRQGGITEEAYGALNNNPDPDSKGNGQMAARNSRVTAFCARMTTIGEQTEVSNARKTAVDSRSRSSQYVRESVEGAPATRRTAILRDDDEDDDDRSSMLKYTGLH